MSLFGDMASTLDGADAVVIATPWPEFRNLSADPLVRWMRQPIVFDPSRHLQQAFGADRRVRYFAVGRGNPITG
jgi:UDPglucose 6-dehydrogenase